MKKKTKIKVSVTVIVESESAIDVDNFFENVDYNFVSKTDNVEVVETEIVEWNVQKVVNIVKKEK